MHAGFLSAIFLNKEENITQLKSLLKWCNGCCGQAGAVCVCVYFDIY